MILFKKKNMQASSRSHKNHYNLNVRNVGQDEAQHRKYKILKLAAVKPTRFQVTKLLLWLRLGQDNT
jgi:hypothetical protein